MHDAHVLHILELRTPNEYQMKWRSIMPKNSKFEPKATYEVWRSLILAGHNVLYAVSFFWETYHKELAASGQQHESDSMEEEMEILKSELDSFWRLSQARNR